MKYINIESYKTFDFFIFILKYKIFKIPIYIAINQVSHVSPFFPIFHFTFSY